MTRNLESLDYRTIDTPWEPQPIVWGRDMAERGHDALRDEASIPTRTHLVREVRSTITASKKEEIHAYLALADEHFNYLEALTSVRVAPYEWYILNDQDSRPRILARVAIIDGYSTLTKNEPQATEVREAIATYYSHSHPSGYILGDLGITQFMYGNQRGSTQTQSSRALWLVDIEPVLVRY